MFNNLNHKEPLVLREIPDRPWKNIAIDLFHFSGKEYLLIVDIYSKFPEIICLNKNTTADNVINKTKEVLARHGKPDIIYSDNGPQFNCFKFKQFMDEWEIVHQTSSPQFPQSNGF